jgi:uncharacterized protein
LKTLPGNKSGKTQRRRVSLRRTPIETSKLPKDVQEFMQKFREWEESFRSPAKRMDFIKRICGRIADVYKPERIILFGSHAYGKPAHDSDIDLLIVMNFEGSPIKQSIKISSELGIVTPMDLLVRTPEQVRERLRIEDPFIREILQHGKVMYEANILETMPQKMMRKRQSKIVAK